MQLIRIRVQCGEVERGEEQQPGRFGLPDDSPGNEKSEDGVLCEMG